MKKLKRTSLKLTLDLSIEGQDPKTNVQPIILTNVFGTPPYNNTFNSTLRQVKNGLKSYIFFSTSSMKRGPK